MSTACKLNPWEQPVLRCPGMTFRRTMYGDNTYRDNFGCVRSEQEVLDIIESCKATPDTAAMERIRQQWNEQERY